MEKASLFCLNQTAKIAIHEYMKKVWIYKRKNIKSWWVGWYESGQRKTKALPTKALAEHYRQIKYTQLNPTFSLGE